ncbi:MAG: hypothetical protein ACTS73_07490 [Arsenophonus sp. NEOnobi-MAG3]
MDNWGCFLLPVVHEMMTLPPLPPSQRVISALSGSVTTKEELIFLASLDYSQQLLAVIKQCNTDKITFHQVKHYR